MNKDIKEKVARLLEHGTECEYLDFKQKQYPGKKNPDLIKDILAMVNSNYDGDKFIITGVSDEGEIVGLDQENSCVDSAIYQEIILNYIDPDIKVNYFNYEYNGKTLGVILIPNENNDRPFLIKKELDNIREGSCFIRKGSRNCIANRSDFYKFYQMREEFEVSILDNHLRATNDLDGVAYLEVTMRNYTNLPVTITGGGLYVMNESREVLSKYPVYGFNKHVGADFQLSLTPTSEVVGDLCLGFNSSDCLRLSINEDGITCDKFIFKLMLIDTKQNEYVVESEDCSVFANGKFLWKVRMKNK